MIRASKINPDVELRDFLQSRIVVGKAGGGTEPVAVYGDWERPTNNLPADFIVIFINGDVHGVGSKVNYADGDLMIILYCKMNDDGSVKKNRVTKILEQFETIVDKAKTQNFFFALEMDHFITPTTPSQSSGYSTTTLNLRWHTTNNFNAQ